jgi:GT2 family glycosyltransferase
MRTPPSGIRRFARIAILRIALLCHALGADPLKFAQAIAWRTRGLRVRSKNTIAMLAIGSPHTYRLWIETREYDAIAATRPVTGSERITFLIFADQMSRSLDDSFASIRRDSASPDDQIIVYGMGGFPSHAQAAPVPSIRFVQTADELLQLLRETGSTTLWCPMLAGDRISRNFRDRYLANVPPEHPTILYSDDDLIDAADRRHSPHFKPDWNSVLFEHQDFLTFSSVHHILRDYVPSHWDGRDPRRLIGSVLTAMIAGSTAVEPQHVPHVLHHRIVRHLEPLDFDKKPMMSIPAQAKTAIVSIIVPTKDRLELLGPCIESVRKTALPNIELIVIDHQSEKAETLAYFDVLEAEGVKIERWAGNFNFSAMNNAAAKGARGDLLCFLNNDIEVLSTDWLTHMRDQACRPYIGAVGAQLLYPDGTIQHAGVVLGLGGAAGHAHKSLGRLDEGYFHRHSLPQFVSAVTAACMLVERRKFEAVGGFDAVDFAVAFNDVDLCLKLGAAGWKNLYEPRATLIHHESKTRGSDLARRNRARFGRELKLLKEKWGTDRIVDPYHNVNLSRLCEAFVIDV